MKNGIMKNGRLMDMVNCSPKRHEFDEERYNIINKFGYNNGTFIQCLIDYHEKNNGGRTIPNKEIIRASPTQQEIFNQTGMSLFVQRGICNKLKSLEILKIKRIGIPPQNRYKLYLWKIFSE